MVRIPSSWAVRKTRIAISCGIEKRCTRQRCQRRIGEPKLYCFTSFPRKAKSHCDYWAAAVLRPDCRDSSLTAAPYTAWAAAADCLNTRLVVWLPILHDPQEHPREPAVRVLLAMPVVCTHPPVSNKQLLLGRLRTDTLDFRNIKVTREGNRRETAPQGVDGHLCRLGRPPLQSAFSPPRSAPCFR
ncbi:MAG: hypothetical protein BJ554DRAFT_357 [Olpidium bornovanus]|uniref:Uncharacterized protein n=1 Tax=Olpidium bornovanus TaxID=278681 RepID=A0A8H7ZU38_9FUNG|nr:MAG: hypothetical protein BJ554DRAFT_357 [Olpidium bornovanus]